jgi:hypothetical protein
MLFIIINWVKFRLGGILILYNIFYNINRGGSFIGGESPITRHITKIKIIKCARLKFGYMLETPLEP